MATITSPQLSSKFRSTGKQTQLSCLPAPCRAYNQPNQQSNGPMQHQICGLTPHKITQFPPTYQRQPRTKDVRCLQDPLPVRQGLHWADRRSSDIRLRDHQWHTWLKHPDKSAVTKHSISQGHCIQFHSASILTTKTRYIDHIVREAIETEIHPYNINREGGFCLSKSWKPLIFTLKIVVT
jgi:hypothetical protein